MRLLRRRRGTEAAEKTALHARLDAIAGRGKIELAYYSRSEDAPAPARVQRRFWTPEELAAGNDGE
jgi:hypothetical protein